MKEGVLILSAFKNRLSAGLV